MASIDPERRADCSASGVEPIAAYAINELREIALCAHHVGTHRARLEADGFIIVPIDTFVVKPTGIGTESTGVHYALEG